MNNPATNPTTLNAKIYQDFLQSKGYTVPLPVIVEMLESTLTALTKSEQNDTGGICIRVFCDSDNDWRIIPPHTGDLYEVKDAQEYHFADSRMLVEELERDFLLFEKLNLQPDEARMTALYCVAPRVDKYGLPGMFLMGTLAWAQQEGLPPPASAMEPELHDTGDDSGGATMVELTLTEEAYERYVTLQKELFEVLAETVRNAMKDKATQQGIAFEPSKQIADYERDYPLLAPMFREMVLR